MQYHPYNRRRPVRGRTVPSSSAAPDHHSLLVDDAPVHGLRILLLGLAPVNDCIKPGTDQTTKQFGERLLASRNMRDQLRSQQLGHRNELFGVVESGCQTRPRSICADWNSPRFLSSFERQLPHTGFPFDVICDDWFFIPIGGAWGRKYHSERKIRNLMLLSQKCLAPGGRVFIQMHPLVLLLFVENRGLWDDLRRLFHFRVLSTPDQLNKNPLWRASTNDSVHPTIKHMAESYAEQQHWRGVFVNTGKTQKSKFLGVPEIEELVAELLPTEGEPHVFLMLWRRSDSTSRLRVP